MAKIPSKKTAVAAAAAGITSPKIDPADVAIYQKAKGDPAIIAAAQITNGMPADEVFAAVVKAARAAGA